MIDMAEKLILNTLTFDYPAEPVKFYFSAEDDAQHKSSILQSPVLVPAEVKAFEKFSNMFAGMDGFKMYTTFDLPTAGFEEIEVDFHNPANEYLVKRYYNRRLRKFFQYYDDVVVTESGITKDVEVWLLNREKESRVTYNGKVYKLLQMDKFTLRVKFDPLNKTPYLLVANNRPSLLLNTPLAQLFADAPDDPFCNNRHITPSMINLVMTREKHQGSNGKEYIVRKIDKYDFLQKNNKPCQPETTRPIMSGDLKRFFGLDRQPESRSMESKYVRYKEKIDAFRQRFLNTKDIENIFRNLADTFTEVSPAQVGQTDSSKRQLVFGKKDGAYYKDSRQQNGVNYGPHVNCPYTDVRLIAIYHEADKDYAAHLLGYFRNGDYGLGENKETNMQITEAERKRLGKYMGTNVDYAKKSLHIPFKDKDNPIPEIATALKGDAYRQLDPKAKYIGIYVSPIHKYASSEEAKECYYKIKEMFLKLNIPTQVIDAEKMKTQQRKDKVSRYNNFIYTLQNMGVAICAKLGGSPWLLDEAGKKELIIGIGAFRSDRHQYIGATFSFDNTGVFNDYTYFPKSQLGALVGAIRMEIIRYTTVNNTPERLIIHYYKKISRKREFKMMEDMLHQLELDIPVYIVTINKTESEDIVVFDELSTYLSRTNGTAASLMPYSGTWVNLGHGKEGHRYLLCNNTRYEDGNFKSMDGFPFPIKLTIACPNRKDELPTTVVKELIDQVYQFSRIYWKSVKQQGLPVTIKYPEMIAEIMPHFNDPKVYIDNKCLWFL